MNHTLPIPKSPGECYKLTITTLSVAMVLILTSCRSKLDVETKSGAPVASPAVPAELPKLEPPKKTAGESKGPKKDPNAVVSEGGKFTFQVRDTVKIFLSKAFVEGASTLDIYNVTNFTEENEASAPLIVENYPIPLNLYLDELLLDGEGFQMTTQKDAIVLNIFSQDSKARRALNKGLNRLKIVVDDATNPRYTYVEIIINGVSHFEFAYAGFANNVQRAAAVNSNTHFLEGWINLIAPVSVKDSSGQTSLTVGLNNMMHSY